MAMKSVKVTILGSLLACLFGLENTAGLFPKYHYQGSDRCVDGTRIDEKIVELSNEDSDYCDACKEIVEYANRSSDCREHTIADVLRTLRNTNPNSDGENFKLWVHASGVLLELKAVEAMDLWIEHLNLRGSVVTSEASGTPIIFAVKQMGDLAIPKLTYALRYNPDRQVRIDCAFCLSGIASEKARDALKGSVDFETDACVRDYIKNCLVFTDPGIKHIPFSDEDRMVRSKLAAHWCLD
jgi:hypothetical protein